MGKGQRCKTPFASIRNKGTDCGFSRVLWWKWQWQESSAEAVLFSTRRISCNFQAVKLADSKNMESMFIILEGRQKCLMLSFKLLKGKCEKQKMQWFWTGMSSMVDKVGGGRNVRISREWDVRALVELRVPLHRRQKRNQEHTYLRQIPSFLSMLISYNWLPWKSNTMLFLYLCLNVRTFTLGVYQMYWVCLPILFEMTYNKRYTCLFSILFFCHTM